jgi:hypothetical protein
MLVAKLYQIDSILQRKKANEHCAIMKKIVQFNYIYFNLLLCSWSVNDDLANFKVLAELGHLVSYFLKPIFNIYS